ncbi:MAG: zinc ribbon domain-containing protein [Verrucomicrobiales bacterium]
MITYIYETIPANPQDETERFEWRQSIHDAPLERHPETGALVRRVVTGGLGLTPSGGESVPVGNCCQGSCAC